MRSVKLVEASKEDLVAYARNVLNAEIDARLGVAALRLKLEELGAPEDLSFDDDVPLSAPSVVPSLSLADQDTADEIEDNKRAGFSTVELTVHQQDGEPENVFLNCNGRAMLVPRGRMVTISRKYFEVLKNAVRVEYTASKDGDGALQTAREVPRFAFSVHRMIP